MPARFVLNIFLLATAAMAGIHHIELQSTSRLSSTRSHDNISKRWDQAVLGSQSSKHGVELWYAPGPLGLTVPAALGNPPQPFRLLVDLTWDALFVPSADLDTRYTSPGDMFQYFSNESSTFIPEPTGNRQSVEYGLVDFDGDLVFDTFRIAGVETTHQPFINADSAHPAGWMDLWSGYDGALGLSPGWDTPMNYSSTPSPWSVMVNQSVLDRNLFAIDVPRGGNYVDDPQMGEMSFGGINPKYDSSRFVALPTIQHDDRMWAVEAQSVTWTNETHPIHHEFDNIMAVVTTDWIIALPGSMARQIQESVSQWTGCGFLWCFIDCDIRKRLPDFIFEIAGQNLTLTPFDYAPLTIGPGGQRLCSFDIWSSRAFHDRNSPIPEEALILGTPFLNAFYRLVYSLT
ncbi:acid protease [Hypoxylon crocopeplum]|nr:acid protease [Hypoxylon crocopeplum]